MLIRTFACIAARLVLVAVCSVAASAAAQAQVALTFVAADGLDGRACTVEAQPCKTLQRAVAATNAGGTIRILSDLAGQPFVAIAKPVTVEGGGHAYFGTIAVNSPSVVVTLRGLHLNGRGATASGVIIQSAAAVHIEDCTVERYTNDGMKLLATGATKLFVSGTVASANLSDGLYVDSPGAIVVIENSGFDQNGSTGLFLKANRSNVSGSSASGNGADGFIVRGGLSKFADTTADGNGVNGFSVREGGSAGAFFDAAKAMGNGAAGLRVESGTIAYVARSAFIGYASSPAISNSGLTFTTKTNVITSITGNSLSATTLD